ncbi:cytochrome c6 chloroplastic [Phtheirospermum japonicum]|uniref:Cytochrome c6 chloroplastic n=1 Tax=Phtheirospermum japonicum TaxID=374723 RepID=A0A830CY33_9LAMI|nr:cytochrome c6 chloroplastic [Phtheirospermum japonicum]
MNPSFAYYCQLSYSSIYACRVADARIVNMARTNLRARNSNSSRSDESSLDLERNYCNDHNTLESSPPPLQQPFPSGGPLSESNTAYFSWPACRLAPCAEDRAHYFGNLQKGVLPETLGQRPTGLQATTLLELMTIRAFHSKLLRRFSLGTAIGFRIRRGSLTDIPAILVFVARKVHRQWLSPAHCLPTALEGPGGVWCDVDVVEFAYYGAPAATPKEQVYTELVDGQETYGTLGAIVKSRSGNRQVGFLTNRHVAVDLDYPSQKMFHPLPPSLGPGVYLGAVERATSFVTDDLWYGIFAGTNPDFNMANVTTLVKGVGEIGEVNAIDLQSPIGNLVGRQVVKVGRSSGLTTGTIMAYSLEYNDEKGICFFTDFLVVGENQQTFDLEGDSGSLILLTSQNGEKPRPVGIIWGGTANRGRLKLKVGQPPENWTSGVDLGRLLDILELDIVTSTGALHVALQEQINASVAGFDSIVGEYSPLEHITTNIKCEANIEPFPNLQVSANDDFHQGSIQPPSMLDEFRIESSSEVVPSIEHQFIPSFSSKPLVNQSQQGDDEEEEERTVGLKKLSVLKDESDGEVSVSLQLGEPDPKRSKRKRMRILGEFNYDCKSHKQLLNLLGPPFLAAAIALSPICFPPVSVGQTVEAQKGGATLFRRACIGCHDAGGNIIQPGATLFLKDLQRNGVDTEQEIYRITYYGKGRMPGFGENCTPRGQCTFGARLQEDEIKLLAGFVKSQADQGWPKIDIEGD